MHVPGRRENARSVSPPARHEGPNRSHRAAPCRDHPGPGVVADPLRRLAGRGDFRRHHHYDRRIPRARASQQRTRAGEYRPPASPSLRPAVRGLRHARRRRDLPAADFRHRLGEGIPETCRKLRSARDPEIQGGRSVLSRRHLHLRFQWRHGQLVAAAAGACPQHFRAGLLQELQIRFAIAVHSDRVGPQLSHRQSEFRHRPSLARRRRHLPRRDDAAHQPRQLRKILRFRRARNRRRHLDVSCRRHPAGALSAGRRPDRPEFREGTAAAAGPGAGHPADATRTKPDRPDGQAGIRSPARALLGRGGRDQHGYRRARRLARTNQVPGHRGDAGCGGDRADSVPHHQADNPAKP